MRLLWHPTRTQTRRDRNRESFDQLDCTRPCPWGNGTMNRRAEKHLTVPVQKIHTFTLLCRLILKYVLFDVEIHLIIQCSAGTTMRKQFVRYILKLLTLCLCGGIKYSVSNSPDQPKASVWGGAMCVFHQWKTRGVFRKPVWQRSLFLQCRLLPLVA